MSTFRIIFKYLVVSGSSLSSASLLLEVTDGGHLGALFRKWWYVIKTFCSIPPLPPGTSSVFSREPSPPVSQEMEIKYTTFAPVLFCTTRDYHAAHQECTLDNFIFCQCLYCRMTQFQIEGGGLVQGVTKLITILLTFVTFNKNYANWVDIFRKCMVKKKSEKKSNILKKINFFSLFLQKNKS